MKSIETLAQELSGTWINARYIDRPEEIENPQWGIYNTYNEYDHLLDKSNAQQIKLIMAPYIARRTAFYVDGYQEYLAVRIYRNDGKITRAFETFYEDIYARLEDYPVLDDEHYTLLEQNTAYDNIKSALQYDISGKVENYDLLLLDDQIQYRVFDQIDGDSGAAYNQDGQGFYPSEDELITALLELGRIKECCDDNVCDCDYPYIAIENPTYPCGCSRLSYEHTCNQLCGHSFGCKCWGK